MNARKGAGRRVVSRLGDHLLTLLAIGGALCIVLVLLSWTFSISIMMFRTGSMSPTITAGSIAFVREIPATEIAEGDIVTVDRGAGVLPVTHRVKEIRSTDPASGEVTFVMQGDANDVEDSEPYTAAEVRRVMFSVPGAARTIRWFSNPYVLGGITAGATLLVIWAFWPRDPDSDGSPAGPDEDAVSLPRQAPTARSLSGLLAVALIVAAPPVSQAETVTLYGEHLRMQTEGDPVRMMNLGPGESAVWHVGVWTAAPEPGEVKIGLAGRGELAELDDALLVSVASCPTRWSGEDCPAGAVALLDGESLDRIAAAEGIRHLTTMPSDQERWLRITVTLNASITDHAVAGAGGDLIVEATGRGERLASGPDPTAQAPVRDGAHDVPDFLARTGTSMAVQFALVALALLLAGAALRRGADRARGRAAAEKLPYRRTPPD